MRTHLPGRPGNEHTWHGERPDWIDVIERGVFYVAVPVGMVALAVFGGGYLISEVAAWMQ